MTAPLVTALNLRIKGVPANVRLASLIVLGCEVHHCKQKLCYSGGGSWQAYRDESKAGTRLPWPDFCKTQAGVTDTAARHYYECGEALKNRLRRVKFTGAKELLGQMGKVPSELTTEQRTALIGEIARMIPDSTQSLLRAEFRAAKLTPEEIKQVRDDPSAAARLEQTRMSRASGVLTEELGRRNPEAHAQLQAKASEAEALLHASKVRLVLKAVSMLREQRANNLI